MKFINRLFGFALFVFSSGKVEYFGRETEEGRGGKGRTAKKPNQPPL